MIEIINGVIFVDGVSQGRNESWYIQIILDRIRSAHRAFDTAFVIGGGAYIIPKQLQELGIVVDTIEINTDFTPKKFNYKPNGTVFFGDFKEHHPERAYDFIIFDAYNGAQPSGTMKEALEAVLPAKKRGYINWVSKDYPNDSTYKYKNKDFEKITKKFPNGMHQTIYEVY